ncbi:MAG: GNAT family protein [Tissierellales bacterium]
MENFWDGEHVRLRAVRESDLENYYLKTNNGDTESIRNSDRMIFPVGDAARAEKISKLCRLNPYAEEYTLIIENKEGEPVGNINTHSCNKTNGTFKYGVGILHQYRGKGYATEAIKILCRYYFEELDYKKAEVEVYEFNQASVLLHEKLGFVKEGTLRSNHYAKGRRWDTYCYGMLREEFNY